MDKPQFEVTDHSSYTWMLCKCLWSASGPKRLVALRWKRHRLLCRVVP